MLTFIREKIIKGFLGNLRSNHKTTLLGFIAAAVLADKTIDWGLLIKGDHQQLVQFVGCAALAVWGYYTADKPSTPAPPPPSN